MASIEQGCPHPRWWPAGETGIPGRAEDPGTKQHRIPFSGAAGAAEGHSRATGGPSCRGDRPGLVRGFPTLEAEAKPRPRSGANEKVARGIEEGGCADTWREKPPSHLSPPPPPPSWNA
ncbi:hypothetical protein NDU88_001238 [Pleurodeles waltl]|uniref:Uncharacterized protein n=1 Tax=Pleurodeles waltl TaxID=8319 RepID=A0AAV7WHU6_PLEWA|nr:hypothetical protein NDU88_001238 [Pleurodeles waltl]